MLLVFNQNFSIVFPEYNISLNINEYLGTALAINIFMSSK